MSATEPQAPAGADPLLTVIVPVYNAMPYLTEFLDSLVEQDLDDTFFDVLLVDDGSTDDGPAVMDEYAARHRNFCVLHEENSGWPGTPRNTGLGLARTKYVFFADSDDVLAPVALRLMVEYAEEHGSDIVIPQMAGMEGRRVPATTLTKPRADLDLVSAFRTLGPIKLYRRSLLADHGIAFPTEKVRLEDGIFNARAYLAAGRISVLAGEDLYHVRSRDDGQNISVQPFEPFGYTGSVAKMCRIVNDAPLDEETRQGIVLGLLQRKCLKIYRPGRFIKYKDYRRADWLAAHRQFVAEFVTPDMERSLSHPYDIRTRLVRAGDMEGLVRLQRLEVAPQVKAALVDIVPQGNALEFAVDVSVEGAVDVDQLACELWSRDGNGHAAFTLRAVHGSRDGYAEPRRFTGTLPAEAASGLANGVYDLHATRLVGKKHVAARIAASPGEPLNGLGWISAYATVHGNLSLKKESVPPATVQTGPRAATVSTTARRLARRGIRKASSVVGRLRRGR